jgi:hypothetical protein
MNISLIRELIEEGLTDAQIEACVDDERCESNDARRAEEDDAGFTPLDAQLMRHGPDREIFQDRDD